MKQENQQLVYKHAISTIIPDKALELLEDGDMKKTLLEPEAAK
jgi:sRNA-binding regulator protein Hfq